MVIVGRGVKDSRSGRLARSGLVPQALLFSAVAGSCLWSSESWLFQTNLRRSTAMMATGSISSPGTAVEAVTIEMPEPLDGKVGVAIQAGRRTVSRLAHKDASSVGWRVGDVITEVNGVTVNDNDAVRAAVGSALEAYRNSGQLMRFVVQRRVVPKDTSRGMLRMTPGTGGALTMSMLDLLTSALGEFPVVIFMDGTIKLPESNLAASAIRALMDTGLAFKAVDCVDDRYNPGAREAIEELAGEYALPQLYAGGKRIGNGHKIQELAASGSLAATLRDHGAVEAELSK
eukprot:TRINITY_DN17184_c0_g1_i1.p1 TRINITY_DN17184_c0_g1~~TRINITY_DN17184_c0_g1_i1.p1  ORF type:complete len:307 (-),score=46.75 TRINITY_DN17184_c0_g1_i1:217-1080(-)